MPTGKNWLNFIYVNLGFVIGVSCIYLFASVKEIREKWPEYRCNPMYMPLSENISEDFTYCVQNMQSNMMGYMLQPITYVLSNITNMSGQFMQSIQDVREMFNKIRTFATSIIQTIFGVFLNIIIEFQKITIGIKDLIGKIIGVMVVLLYLMDGSIKTMKSAWNGPPGQLTRALGKCFHPKTKVKLFGGKIVAIEDLEIGNTLDDGSRIIATMKIDNKDIETREELYILRGRGVEGSDIYVTGSHLVVDSRTSRYVKVCDYFQAEKQNEVVTDWFCCLVTSTNKIQIGKEIFCDWEDHIEKLKLMIGI
jgi:hypothetical protein